MKIIPAIAVGLSIVAAAAASAAVPAQAAWIIETHDHVDDGYTIMDFAYIAGSRDLKVVVRGNPTDTEQAKFEAGIASLMTAVQPGYQSQARFTANPNASARGSYKVVMVFGDKGVSENRACADPDSVPAAYSGGRLYLTAVFCWRDERINSVWARVGGVTSTTDQALADMTSGSMRRMFPDTWRYQ